MKPSLKVIFLFAAVIFIQSCGPTLSITTDYDHSANLMQYKTFRIVEPDAQHQTISSLNHDRIYDAVRANLTGKGFKESADADLLVNIVTIIKNEKSLSANTYGTGGYYRSYGWGGGSSNTTVTVQDNKTGSLIVDIVDAKANKLVWTATGNQEIDKPLSDPVNQIPVIVNKIMASFPGGATK
jgi:Domain of unknown function (DUF4136)